jgi:uncharacterized protein YcbX
MRSHDEHLAAVLAQLWRYPVKSLGGERVGEAVLDARGLEGDREWALVDPEGGIASGKTTRRFRKVLGLMHHRSALDGDAPVITLADGRSARAGTPELAALVAEIAPPGWALARENGTPHHDAAPVHVVSTGTLATLSALAGEPFPVQRLRPNLLIDTGDGGEPFPEDGWIGRTLRIGGVELEIAERTERCVMVTHPQAGVEARPRLLQQIGRANGACAGVYATVRVPGTLRAGATVELL